MLGAELYIDGTSITNNMGSAAGGGLNSTLEIHRRFRPIDMNRAYLNQLSFGVAALIELSGVSFDVYSSRGTELFSFDGAELGGTMGAKLKILNYTRLVFSHH